MEYSSLIAPARSVIPLCLYFILFSLCWINTSPADDVVVYRVDSSSPQQTRRGKIIEYSGQQVALKVGNGQTVTIPTKQILHFKTTWSSKHQSANKLFEQRDFAGAETQFTKILTEEVEKHPQWVLRTVISQRILCRTARQKHLAAATDFFSLLAADPATQFFGVIPLNWHSKAPDAALQQKARSWLTDSDPIKQLLGASWLLSTERIKSKAVLKKLAENRSPRIAFLATAQLWRTETATADRATIEKWKSILARMPKELRAGPYFVCGKTMIQKGMGREGQLMLLKVTYLYPQHDQLAAISIWNAAQSLAKLTQDPKPDSESTLLLRELIAKYPKTEYAANAKAMLETNTLPK